MHVCAAVEAQAHSHHRKDCFTVWAISPADGNGHPPMAQLTPTKVILTLLLSCLVFEGTATKSGLRNPPIKNVFIGLSCGADQC